MHAMSLPDPGTTMPPATCSVKTMKPNQQTLVYPLANIEPHTKVVVSKHTWLISFGGKQICQRGEVTDIVPT
jgi:hypothetical protein